MIPFASVQPTLSGLGVLKYFMIWKTTNTTKQAIPTYSNHNNPATGLNKIAIPIITINIDIIIDITYRSLSHSSIPYLSSFTRSSIIIVPLLIIHIYKYIIYPLKLYHYCI